MRSSVFPVWMSVRAANPHFVRHLRIVSSKQTHCEQYIRINTCAEAHTVTWHAHLQNPLISINSTLSI
jgi:hypothetical protein